MKKILVYILVIASLLPLFSCNSEGKVVNMAKAFIDEGKYQEAYALLYENRKYSAAKEMLEFFTINVGRLTSKNYSIYDDITEVTYNEYGDIETKYRKYSNMADKIEVTITNTNTYENGKLIKCATTSDGYGDNEQKEYTYDQNGNLICELTSYFNNDGSKVTYTSTHYFEYDENGNLTKDEDYSDDDLHCVTLYDSKGNKIKETIFIYSGEPMETTYSYNEKDQLIKETTSSEKDTIIKEYIYNEHGDISKEITTREYLFDGDTVPTSSTFEIIYEYEYDEKGNMTKKSSSSIPEGITSSEEMSYNERGDVIKHYEIRNEKDHILIETEYEYFKNGKIKKQRSIKNAWYESEMISEYDDHGNIIKESSGDRKNIYEYSYNADGLVVLKKETLLDGIPTYHEYTYNEKKELIKEIEYDEDGKSKAEYHEYTYDENGVLIKEETNENDFKETYIYSYNDHGDLISKHSESYGSSFQGPTYEYTYDANGKMLTKKDYDSEGELTRLHEYDSAGNEIKLTYYFDGKEGRWHEKEYNEDGKLVKFTSIGVGRDGEKEVSFIDTYTYNDNGNLISRLRDGYQYEVYANLTEYFDYEYFYTPKI